MRMSRLARDSGRLILMAELLVFVAEAWHPLVAVGTVVLGEVVVVVRRRAR